MALTGSLVVSSFLQTLTQEYQITHRAHYHGTALYIAEAGIEEALAMMNYGSNRWGACGWSSSFTDYTKATNLTEIGGTAFVGSYVVSILGATNDYPVAVCTGIVDCASTTASDAINTNLVRAIRATLGKRPVYQWGLMAQSQVNLNGNSISIDSFDSSDPNYSNFDITTGFGTYDPSKNKDSGDIVSNAGVTNTISVGNADVYGHINVGPGGGVSVGPNGFVAALGQGVNGVVDSTRVSHSMSVELPPATLPSGWSSFSNLGEINGAFTIDGGSGGPLDLTASKINITSSDTIRFHSGYTRLYVSGDLAISGNASILIDQGAKVEIYVGGTVSIAGNGVANGDLRSTSFQLYSLNSGDVTISGNGQLIAALYAPQSEVTFSGGGESGAVIGAIVGKTINLGGHVSFHYDENLKKHGPTRGYSVMAWQEI